MRIHDVAAVVVQEAHLGFGFLGRREGADEIRLQFRSGGRRERIASRGGEVVHELLHRGAVAVVDGPEEALHVGALADVHRRRVRDRERGARVVGARGDEAREHVVHVRGAHELPDRRAELLRVVGGEDVAEVAGGNDHVKGGLCFRGRVEVVGDLGHEAADVDRVGGGEGDTRGFGLGADGGVGEDALHGGLRVIEVAADGDAVHVGGGRRGHLELLDARGARVREEHGDFYAGDVREARHRGGAGVARGGGEDQHALALRGGGHEDGQHGEGHVLERARRAVEELEDLEAVGVDERDGVVGGELGEEVADGVLAHGLGHVVEERAEGGALGVGERGPVADGCGGGGVGDEESAVGREPAQDGWQGIDGEG